MSEQNYRAWLRSPHESPKPRQPAHNRVEVGFWIDRNASADEGDAWLREAVEHWIKQGSIAIPGCKVEVEFVRVMD